MGVEVGWASCWGSHEPCPATALFHPIHLSPEHLSQTLLWCLCLLKCALRLLVGLVQVTSLLSTASMPPTGPCHPLPFTSHPPSGAPASSLPAELHSSPLPCHARHPSIKPSSSIALSLPPRSPQRLLSSPLCFHCTQEILSFTRYWCRSHHGPGRCRALNI